MTPRLFHCGQCLSTSRRIAPLALLTNSPYGLQARWQQDFYGAGGGIRTPEGIKPPGLQPGAFGHFATPAQQLLYWSRLSDSNRRPTVYKTVALPLS